MSSRRKAATASTASSRSPEVATITGSSTMLRAPWRAEAFGHGLDRRHLRQHADLDRADGEVAEHRVDLRGDEIRQARRECR